MLKKTNNKNDFGTQGKVPWPAGKIKVPHGGKIVWDDPSVSTGEDTSVLYQKKKTHPQIVGAFLELISLRLHDRYMEGKTPSACKDNLTL